MNCKQCQEIILTDYLDDQLGANQLQQINLHLSSCTACSEFAQTARKMVIEPFAQSVQHEPPASVWNCIKEEIVAEEDEYEYQESWLEQLKKKLWPRPTFALATVACIALVTLVVIPNNQSQQIVAQDVVSVVQVAQVQSSTQEFAIDEEIDYIAYLFDDQDDASEYNDVYEEYFL